MKNLNQVFEAAKIGEGSTYSITFGGLGDKNVYVISLSGHEEKCPQNQFNIETLKGYVNSKLELLAEPRNFLGVWVKDGQVFMDVSDIWDKEEWQQDGILEIGRLREQIAVWDNETKEELQCFDVIIRTRKDFVCAYVCRNQSIVDKFVSTFGYSAKGLTISFDESSEDEISPYDSLSCRKLGFNFLVVDDFEAFNCARKLDELMATITPRDCFRIAGGGDGFDNMKVITYCNSNVRAYYYRQENRLCPEVLKLHVIQGYLNFVGNGFK